MVRIAKEDWTDPEIQWVLFVISVITKLISIGPCLDFQKILFNHGIWWVFFDVSNRRWSDLYWFLFRLPENIKPTLEYDRLYLEFATDVASTSVGFYMDFQTPPKRPWRPIHVLFAFLTDAQLVAVWISKIELSDLEFDGFYLDFPTVVEMNSVGFLWNLTVNVATLDLTYHLVFWVPFGISTSTHIISRKRY